MTADSQIKQSFFAYMRRQESNGNPDAATPDSSLSIPHPEASIFRKVVTSSSATAPVTTSSSVDQPANVVKGIVIPRLTLSSLSAPVEESPFVPAVANSVPSSVRSTSAFANSTPRSAASTQRSRDVSPRNRHHHGRCAHCKHERDDLDDPHHRRELMLSYGNRIRRKVLPQPQYTGSTARTHARTRIEKSEIRPSTVPAHSLSLPHTTMESRPRQPSPLTIPTAWPDTSVGQDKIIAADLTPVASHSVELPDTPQPHIKQPILLQPTDMRAHNHQTVHAQSSAIKKHHTKPPTTAMERTNVATQTSTPKEEMQVKLQLLHEHIQSQHTSPKSEQQKEPKEFHDIGTITDAPVTTAISNTCTSPITTESSITGGMIDETIASVITDQESMPNNRLHRIMELIAEVQEEYNDSRSPTITSCQWLEAMRTDMHSIEDTWQSLSELQVFSWHIILSNKTQACVENQKVFQ